MMNSEGLRRKRRDQEEFSSGDSSSSSDDDEKDGHAAVGGEKNDGDYSIISDLTSVSPFAFSKGSHGSLIKRQQNPRGQVSVTELKNRQFKKFADNYFGGNMTDAAENVRMYRSSMTWLAGRCLISKPKNALS
jgi:hypothetical protein